MHFIKRLSAFKPTKFSGCALWLAADRGVTTVDGKVSAWADQSGNGNHAAQTTANYRPLYVASAQGGRPTLRFDGSNDVLSVGSPSLPMGSSTRTGFVVVKRETSSTEGYIFKYGALSAFRSLGFCFAHQGTTSAYLGYYAHDVFKSSASDTSGTIWTFGNSESNVSSSFLYKNGSSQMPLTLFGSDGTINTTAGAMYIGDFSDAHSYPFYGDISEIIIFNRALTDNERIKVEQYLSGKYAITLS